ncbi:MAG: GH92 family glycosyl hydrolase [Bacteroidales bacterium]
MNKYFRAGFIIAGFMAGLVSCNSEKRDTSLLNYVDMFIGTAKQGHTIVSPARPFAMVKPGPDTEMRRNYLHAKYITGFSQLHISGTGGNAQSAVLGIMPTTGKIYVDPKQYMSAFNPLHAKASPGYNSFFLDDYQIETEITSTDRVALYRFTFPESNEAHILINVAHAFNKYRGGDIRVLNDSTIVGTGKYNGYHGSDFDIAFYLQFSKPFSASGIWDENGIHDNLNYSVSEDDGPLGVFVNYQTGKDEKIMVKAGISYVDIDGAGKNITHELNNWNFERVVEESQQIWEDHLRTIQVKGATEDQKKTFYTALYHTMLSPCLLSDIDNRYEGFDGNIHTAEGFNYYGEFSLWDTYRTVHPLYTLIQPKRQRDMVVSLLKTAEQGGWLPKWGWSEGYTGGMLGDHAVSVILDSYVKGIQDFDTQLAYRAMYKNATEKLEGVPWGRRGLNKYMALGFAPEDAGYMKSLVAETHAYGPGGAPSRDYYPEISGSVSATVEFAYNDWCVAEMARLLGKEEDNAYFRNRAYNYKNVYDPSVGFMRPRNSDGSWAMNPFVSTVSGQHSQFYCEGNAWTYSWTIPHDIQGVVNLMEGPEMFINKLDSAFAGIEENDSYFDPTNEPDIHYPYLYNYVKAPWRTQEIVRFMTENLYSSDWETGLPGDEDVGTLSAWYIFSAMGFYPVTPGTDQYVIGSPLFDEVTIYLDEDFYSNNKLSLKTINNSPSNKYIQSIKLNNKAINRTWLRHNELVNGGNIVFELGSKPNKNWGTDDENTPMSMTIEKPQFEFTNLTAPEKAEANEYIPVKVTVKNNGALGTVFVKLFQFDRNIHYKRGHFVGQKKIVLDAGDEANVEFSVPMYYHGSITLQIDSLSTVVDIARPDPEKLAKKQEIMK